MSDGLHLQGDTDQTFLLLAKLGAVAWLHGVCHCSPERAGKVSPYMSFSIHFFLSAILLIAAVLMPMADLCFSSGRCGGLGSKAAVIALGQACRNKRKFVFLKWSYCLKTEVHPYSTGLLGLTWLTQSGHSFIFWHKLADLFLDSKTVG